MKKKSERLQSVHAVADRDTQLQAGEYNVSRASLEQQQKKLSDLKQYYAEYSAASSLHRVESLDIQRLLETRQFMNKLSDAIAQQGHIVSQAEGAVIDSKNKWVNARKKSKSLEQLSSNQRDIERKHDDVLQQKAADDLNAQRFVWRNNQHNNFVA